MEPNTDRNPVKVTLSNNKFEAHLTIDDTSRSFPTEAELLTEIRNAGVIFGVDRQALREIVYAHRPVRNAVIAIGQNPFDENGSNLIWYVNFARPLRPKITRFGKADFKQLNQPVFVQKNQEIVSRVPASAVVGKTVTGEDVTDIDQWFRHLVGNNITISGDGLTLSAAIEGCLFWKAGKLNVDVIYHIGGDVDYSTGNVKFDGAILIDGDVRSGFRVDATGSIYINGSVEAAEVYSEKGDIVIASGILGKGRAKIITSGNLICRFLQDAHVGAKKDVIIEHYAINCSISAGEKVLLVQNEGLIRGGRAYAEGGMKAVEVGSKQSIPTDIGISGEDNIYLNADKWQLEKQAEEYKVKLSIVEKKISFLNLLKIHLKSLSPEKQVEMEKLREEKAVLAGLLAEKEKEAQTFLEQKMSLDETRYIEISDKMHRGVTVTIGDQQYFTNKTVQNVKIYRKGNDILVENLGEPSCN